MKIAIKGPIISDGDQWIYDWFDIPATSPKKVNELLSKASQNEEIEVDINSGGGSVFDASEIYTALKSHAGKVTGRIVGLAASSASIIAMAADHLMMAPTAQMMIHNASVIARGDYRDMDHTSDILKNTNQTIANAYNLKCGRPYDELLELMDAETWMTPQQAKELNLIDEVMFEESSTKIVASTNGDMLPPEVIEKMRNELKPLEPKNQLITPAAVTNSVSSKKGEEKMTIEELKNSHPELYNLIKKEGHDEGVKAENTRIKNIEDLQLPGNEDLVNKAKFETNMSAEALAVEIIKAEKNRGQNFLSNRKEDAEDLKDVPGEAAPENNSKNDDVKAEEKGLEIAAFINKTRGGTK